MSQSLCCSDKVPKSNLGGNGLFGLHIPSYSPLREAKAGTWSRTEAEALEDTAYWLAPMASQPAFLLNLGPPTQKCHVHSELGPPSSIVNQENAM